MRVSLGPKLEWDFVVFTSFGPGQSADAARAVVVEWVQAQQSSVRGMEAPAPGGLCLWGSLARPVREA